MTNFGEYRVTYSPSEWGEGSMDPEIQMTISAEANLAQMVSFFESFLKAAGYQFGELDYQTTVTPVEEKIQAESSQDFWEDDGFSMVGNPWDASFLSSKSDEGTFYIGSGVLGAAGEDHLSFSPVGGQFGSSTVTFF